MLWLRKALRDAIATPFFATAAAALALCATSGAQSQLSFTLQGTGGPISVIDNVVFDTNPALGLIGLDVPGISPFFPDFQIASLTATDNRATGGPNDPASLIVTGMVQRVQGLQPASLTIMVSDTGFLFPAGNPKTMTTAASDTFTNTGPGSSATFQSYFDFTNTPFGTAIPSPLLAFVPPVGAGPFTLTNPGVATPLGAQPVPYSLTNITVLTLVGGETIQYSGSTVISASPQVVPEPGTYAMLGGMLIPGGLYLLRRRRA